MGNLRKTSAAYSDMSPEEASKLRKTVAKKIEYQKQFDAPESPSRIYHGSQSKIDEFEARPHYLAEDEPVVFGTPSRTQAVSFLAPWRDSDFEQGTYNDDPLLHMTEQYPGALEKIYKGKRGYMYELDPSNFEWGPQLMRGEFISKEVPEVLNSEELDVYEAMLAEEEAGRLKIHRAKETPMKKLAQDTSYSPSQLALAASIAGGVGYGGLKAYRAYQEPKKEAPLGALEHAGMVGAGGLATAGVGVGAGKALKNLDLTKLKDSIIRGVYGDSTENAAKLKKFLEDTGTKVDSENYGLKANDGRQIRVNLPTAQDQAMRASMAPYQQDGWTLPDYKGKSYKGGNITLGKKFQSPEVFLHELGHATGKKIPQHDILLKRKITRGTGGAAILAALAGGTATTKEEAEAHNTLANVILGAGAVNQAPLLLEEARANIRAPILAKRLGYKPRLGVKPLLFGMGTYGIGAAKNLALPIVNKLLAQNTLENRTKTSAEQEDHYVYHVSPREAADSVAQRGILSGAAMLEDPEMLAGLAKKRNWTVEKQRARIQKNLEDEYWHKKETSPSVFFSAPDWSKVPEGHTLRADPYDLYRINLSKYMRETPGAKIHGVELKPWTEGTPYEERGITEDEVREYAARGPEGLWKDFTPVEGYYAVDVPHAFLGSDANKISPEYIENMGELVPEEIKTASAQYRPRGTLILRNDKGQVYAGKASKPGTSPYYFPGGGIFEEEGVDRVPTESELAEGMNREALEELGYAIKNYKPLANLQRTYSKEWQDKAEKKRGVRYLGENEYYATAELGDEDTSLYDVEGDAFTSGDWYDPLAVAKALEGGDPTNTFYDSNLEEAAMLRKMQPKTAQENLSVLTAVPKQNLDLIMRKGLASQKAISEDPELTEAYLKQRGVGEAEWREELAAALKGWHPESRTGPSVFFTPPDPDKVSDPRHFINQFDTTDLRVNLDKLMRDVPGTRVFGSELEPYSEAEHKADPDNYPKRRRRDLTRDEILAYTNKDPKELWKHYLKKDIGKYYASNVPHGKIITPSGIIPPEYLEQVTKTTPEKLKSAILKTAGVAQWGASAVQGARKGYQNVAYHPTILNAQSAVTKLSPAQMGGGVNDALGEVAGVALTHAYPAIAKGVKGMYGGARGAAKDTRNYFQGLWGSPLRHGPKTASSDYLQKVSVAAGDITRAARKLVYNSPLRTSTKIPKGQFAREQQYLDAVAGRSAASTPSLDVIKSNIADTEGALAQVRSHADKTLSTDRAFLRDSRAKIQEAIPRAKEEALAGGEPSAWRDYLPRLGKQRRAARNIQGTKKQIAREEANLGHNQKRLEKAIESNSQAEAHARRARAGYGEAMTTTHKYNPDGTLTRIPMAINVHGHAGKSQLERAITALHERREMLTTSSQLKRGLSEGQIKNIGTDVLGIQNSGHASVTVPMGDANIYRTLTGEGSEQIARNLDALRAPELIRTKELLPEAAPIIDQLLGQGVAFGSRAKPNYVSAAEQILSGARPASQAAKQRAKQIVDSYTVGTAPNRRINRNEIKRIQDLSERKFASLSEAIHKTSSTDYLHKVAPQFQGYVSQKRTKITIPIKDLPQTPPPKDNSQEVGRELLQIQRHMKEAKLPKALMGLANDNPAMLYFIACEKLDIDPLEKQALEIKEDFNKIAFDLKYKFKRLRPWSLAPSHGIELNVDIPDSADTPSYPSGHAMMGYGLAEFYKSHYPEYSKQWDKIADIIQHSRLQAGVHFPSDVKYAKELVMSIGEREKVAAQDPRYNPYAVAGGVAAAGAVGYGGYKAYENTNILSPYGFNPQLPDSEWAPWLAGGALAAGAYLGRGKLKGLSESISKRVKQAPPPVKQAPPPVKQAPPPVKQAPPPVKQAPPPVKQAPQAPQATENFVQQRDRVNDQIKRRGFGALTPKDQIFTLDASRSQWTPDKLNMASDDVVHTVFKNNKAKVREAGNKIVQEGEATPQQLNALAKTPEGRRAIMLNAFVHTGGGGIEGSVKAKTQLGAAINNIGGSKLANLRTKVLDTLDPIEEQERMINAGVGAATALGIIEGTKLTNKGFFDNVYSKWHDASTAEHADGRARLREAVLNNSTPGPVSGTRTLTAKDGREILLRHDAANPNKASWSSGVKFLSRPELDARYAKGGMISLGVNSQTPEAFFHELGHATGKKQVLPIHRALSKSISRGSSGAAAISALMGNRSETKAEAEAHNTAANAILGVSAANQAPLLVEEARANLRAQGLAKTFGLRGALQKRKLLGYFGTYGLGALKAMALPIANKALASRQVDRMSEGARSWDYLQ